MVEVELNFVTNLLQAIVVWSGTRNRNNQIAFIESLIDIGIKWNIQAIGGRSYPSQNSTGICTRNMQFSYNSWTEPLRGN